MTRRRRGSRVPWHVNVVSDHPEAAETVGIAMHEAGHATLMLHYGHGIENVFIDFSQDWLWGAVASPSRRTRRQLFVEVPRGSGNFTKNPQLMAPVRRGTKRLREDADVRLAGIAAEVVMQRGLSTRRVKQSHLNEILRELVARQDPPGENLPPDWQQFARLTDELGETDPENYALERLPCILAVLLTHWEFVAERLAFTLFVTDVRGGRKTVSGRYARRLWAAYLDGGA